MLLIDLSSVVVSGVLATVDGNDELTEHNVRSIAMYLVTHYTKKYKKYGDVVICADARDGYWRRDKFKHYKMNRKKTREKSDFDWDTFHIHFNTFKEELEHELPWRFVEASKAEGDDVIAILTRRYSIHEDIMIVSADKDMIQLQIKCQGNISQYSPMIKKLMSVKSSGYSLIRHYIKGDSSDGIPNILSDSDVFVCEEKRQKSIKKQMVVDAEHLKNPEYICPNADALDKYKRNRELIDVDYIPNDIAQDIITRFEQSKPKLPRPIYKYMIKHGLGNLMNRR